MHKFLCAMMMILSVLAATSVAFAQSGGQSDPTLQIDASGQCRDEHCTFWNDWYNKLPCQASAYIDFNQTTPSGGALGKVEINFKWCEDPQFHEGQAFEIDAVFQKYEGCGEKNFAEPLNNTDWVSPYDYSRFDFTDEVGVRVEGAYMDVGNHLATSISGDQVKTTVKEYCGFEMIQFEADKVAGAIKDTMDTVPQFSVGTSAPEFLRKDVWYKVVYKIERSIDSCPAGYVVIRADAVRDHHTLIRTSNLLYSITDCPYLIGSTKKECGCSRPWIKRLCVPTGLFSFNPLDRLGSDKIGVGCDNTDGDQFFNVAGSQVNPRDPIPHFGTNVGDCNDNDPLIGIAGYDKNIGACVEGEVGFKSGPVRQEPLTSAFVGAFLHHGGAAFFGGPYDNGGGRYVHGWGNDSTGQPLMVQDFRRPSNGYWSSLIMNPNGKVFPVHGKILSKYADCKNGRTCLVDQPPINFGAPTESEYYCKVPGNTDATRYVRQDFEAGSLCWDTRANVYLSRAACLTCSRATPLPPTGGTTLTVAFASDQDADGYQARAQGGSDCNDTSAQVNPGVQENCVDAVDNNCDGATDGQDNACIAVSAQPCNASGFMTCGVGECTHIEEMCVNGVRNECHPFWYVQPETCDGLDNDCDGATDDEGVCGSTPLECASGRKLGETLTQFTTYCADPRSNCVHTRLSYTYQAQVKPQNWVQLCANFRGVMECSQAFQTSTRDTGERGVDWYGNVPVGDYRVDVNLSCAPYDPSPRTGPPWGTLTARDGGLPHPHLKGSAAIVGIEDGVWKLMVRKNIGACEQGGPPGYERCNGLDDDCDGVTDENLSCEPLAAPPDPIPLEQLEQRSFNCPNGVGWWVLDGCGVQTDVWPCDLNTPHFSGCCKGGRDVGCPAGVVARYFCYDDPSISTDDAPQGSPPLTKGVVGTDIYGNASSECGGAGENCWVLHGPPPVPSQTQPPLTACPKGNGWWVVDGCGVSTMVWPCGLNTPNSTGCCNSQGSVVCPQGVRARYFCWDDPSTSTDNPPTGYTTITSTVRGLNAQGLPASECGSAGPGAWVLLENGP